MEKAKFYHVALAFLLILSACYQDFILFPLIGEIGRNPVVLFFPFLIYYGLKELQIDIPVFKKIDKIFKILIIAYFVSTYFNLLIWFFLGEGTLRFIGENIVIKSFKFSAYYIESYLLYRTIFYLLIRINDSNKISRMFFIVLLLHMGILIIENLTKPYAFSYLHNEPLYYRVRLLTREASNTGGIIVFLFCSVMIFSNSIIQKVTAFLFLAIFFLNAQTKLFLLVFPLSALAASIIINKVNIAKTVLISSVVIAAFSYFALPYLIASFTTDIENYTSTVTRTSIFLTGLKLGALHPFGTGGVYYYYILEQLPQMGSYVSDLLGGGKLREIAAWGAKDAKNISAGSTFSEWVMLIGPFGVYLFYKLCKTLIESSKWNLYAFLGIIYFIITNMFSESLQTRPNWYIYFALLVFAFYKNEKEELVV